MPMKIDNIDLLLNCYILDGSKYYHSVTPVQPGDINTTQDVIRVYDINITHPGSMYILTQEK